MGEHYSCNSINNSGYHGVGGLDDSNDKSASGQLSTAQLVIRIIDNSDRFPRYNGDSDNTSNNSRRGNTDFLLVSYGS
jgi:hypothetical protein